MGCKHTQKRLITDDSRLPPGANQTDYLYIECFRCQLIFELTDEQFADEFPAWDEPPELEYHQKRFDQTVLEYAKYFRKHGVKLTASDKKIELEAYGRTRRFKKHG